MDGFTQIFDLCMAFAGVYMLYSAVTGAGSLFKTETVKKGLEEQYKKYMRLFCIFGGVISLVYALLDYLRIEPFATVMFIVLCVFVIGFGIFFYKFGTHEKA